jgi:hypothetical protein
MLVLRILILIPVLVLVLVIAANVHCFGGVWHGDGGRVDVDANE